MVDKEKTPQTHRGFHHLPDIERMKWQDPAAILRKIGLKVGQTFADIGCGNGYFTIPAAKLVGEGGAVYGVDIDKTGIAALMDKAFDEKLGNLHLTVGEAETSILCESCADFVFLGIDLHDFRDPATVLKNAKRMLKPGGNLVDLDWKKENTPFGPPLEIRFDEAKAGALIEAAGFKIESIKPEGLYHYLIIAKQ
jgi:ubiquinone/menaquinone biosynthesis C-methylase UbiE